MHKLKLNVNLKYSAFWNILFEIDLKKFSEKSVF